MLSNYTVIITGASSGMGKGFAEAFLAEGANIVINARRREVLEQFAIDNVEHIDRIRYVAGDISDASTSKALAQEALSAFGRIDLLINNAGTFIPKPFLEETEESLDHYYSVAMKGSYLATQAVIPTMQEQQGGSIINIGSMWVENPLEATPCSASQIAKGGMHTLTRHLAIEFAKNNIRANTIAPAVIDTSLYDNLMDKAQLQGLANLHPLRKIGELQDIVGLVLHLAKGGDRFVSGQTLFVDGAITAGSHAS